METGVDQRDVLLFDTFRSRFRNEYVPAPASGTKVAFVPA
jgi:hypothetical protein